MAPFQNQLFRARIVSFGNAQIKNLNSIQDDLHVDVFFIDYGNTESVRLREIREITPDLVDRLPPAFAYRCCLDGIEPLPQYNDFLTELIDFVNLIFKCKAKDEANNRYVVELFDALHNDSFMGLYK